MGIRVLSVRVGIRVSHSVPEIFATTAKVPLQFLNMNSQPQQYLPQTISQTHHARPDEHHEVTYSFGVEEELFWLQAHTHQCWFQS